MLLLVPFLTLESKGPRYLLTVELSIDLLRAEQAK